MAADDTKNDPQEEVEQGDKIEVTQLIVLIDRDAGTKLPATIFDYELPVLQEIYGEEQIAEVEEDLVEVDAFTANDAFDALRRKYAQHMDAVLRAYPRVQNLAKSSGLKYVADQDNGKLKQSQITDHSKTPTPKKTAAAKKTAASK
jgi:pyruvate/2-oxoglutarate dehydrogenase complex dihydrolipoamide acyltransferase (E2) component